MKFRDYDVGLLIKECEGFMHYTDIEEIDNDCCPEEQLLINTISNLLLLLDIIKDKEDKL